MLFEKMLNSFTAADIIAILVIISCILLKVLGFDGIIDSALMLVIGYYFGKQYRVIDENKKKKEIA
jgi:hypothetical protein